MDIIDILLAKSMTPQGQISTYATQAQQAVSRANSAVNTAQSAASTASSATTQLQTITNNLTAAADTEIDKLALALAQTNGTGYIGNNITVSYPSNNSTSLQNVVKYYTSTGNNEDGTMTQKAITQALANAGSGSGSGNNIPFNLGQENAGKIVVIDQNGNIISSDTISEEDLINLLLKTNDYIVDGVVGLKLDYTNYSYTRSQEASNYNSSNDFNKYPMYGGRKRCLVSNDGEIVAFYGENDYNENPTNGYQVMVYQPKFYYYRDITDTELLSSGRIIRGETIMISSSPKTGFKIHPLFINENGDQVDYVLLSAYEGSIQTNDNNSYTDNSISNFDNQKLSSVTNARPITGTNNALTVAKAETLAQNRGQGWHITNLRYESAMQMLQIVEFGSPNGQQNIELGISDMGNSSILSTITGSTSSLGNTTGHAPQTTFIVSGSQLTYSENGKRAISYRGVENPWGNLWRYVAGINLIGNGLNGGGKPYICKNYSYNINNLSNYQSVDFNIPGNSGWISGFGYCGEDYDWVFLPGECLNGNSSYPIGDNLWSIPNLNTTTVVLCGGVWNYGLNNGPFYYACDRTLSEHTTRQNARLMYVPLLSNQYYASNKTKWQNNYGG